MFRKINDVELEALQTGFAILRGIFLWPKKGNNTTNVSEILGILFSIIFYPFSVYLCLAYVIFIFVTDANYFFNDLLTSISAIISGTCMHLIIVGFIYKRADIKILLLRITNFERFGKPTDFDKVNRKLNILLLFIAVYAISGAFSFLILAYLSEKECNEVTEKYDLYMICGLILPGWLPFEVDTKLKFYVLHAIQYFIVSLICLASMMVIQFKFACVELLILKCNHLKMLIDESYSSKNSENKYAYYAELVEYHVELIEMAVEISEVFGGILLVLIVGSSLLIGLLGFQCMLEFSARNILHLMGWFVSLSLPCLAGQRLINATETIPFKFYSTTWYNEDIKLQKNTLISITRSNYYLEIKAKNYVNLSMVTYGSVIQSAYSFLAMFSQTYDFDKEKLPVKGYHTNNTIITNAHY